MAEVISRLEQDILQQLRKCAHETTLKGLVDGLRSSGNNTDDVTVRMVLWPLIAAQKVELTRQYTLKTGKNTVSA